MPDDADRPLDVVVCLILETWNDIVEREFARPPDRMIRFLQGEPGVGRLLVVNPWRSVLGQARRRFGRGRDAPFERTATEQLARPLRLRRADSDGTDVPGDYLRYARLVRRAAGRRGLRRPVLISYNPFVAAYGELDWCRSVTYVARDDWAAHPSYARLHETYLASYERLRARSVRTVAVSGVLLDRLAPTGRRAVVPNGVEAAVWRDAGGPTPELDDLPHPIAMYTGTVDSRLSIPCLRALHESLPHASVVFVGPGDAATADAIDAAVPGAVHLGRVGQQRLAALVRAADLCIVPHVRSSLTEAMSPLKVYEYLAAGRPVVATDLIPIHDIHPSVELVGRDQDFGAAAIRALERGPLGERDRLAFIADNDWGARCAQILDVAVAS